MQKPINMNNFIRARSQDYFKKHVNMLTGRNDPEFESMDFIKWTLGFMKMTKLTNGIKQICNV